MRLAAATIAVTLAAAASAVAAPAPWSAPVALSDPTAARPAGPAIAVGRTGAVTVAWMRSLGRSATKLVEAARRPRPAAGFGPAVQVDRPAGIGGAVAVGVDGAATATLAWHTRLRDSTAAAATLSPVGPPGPVVALPSAGLVDDLSLGVEEGGTSIAVWVQPDEATGSGALVVAERAPGAAAFSAPLVLATGASEPALAVAPDGRAVVAWIGFASAVYAARRDPATGWGPSERLSGARTARGPTVAMGSRAGAIVGWLEDAPTVAILGPSGWSAPEAVAPPGPLPFTDRPAVAMDLLGRTAAVAWRQGPAPLALRVAWRGDPARPWRVSRIADPPRNVGRPALVMAQSGDALVAWSQPVGAGAGIRARRVPRGGPLGPAEAVSTGRGSRVEPRLAIGTGGVVSAAWLSLPQAGVPFAGRIRIVAATRRARLV